MQGYWINSPIYEDVVISDPQAFGIDTAADSNPVFKVMEEATDTVIKSGSFVARSGFTNQYRMTFTPIATDGFELFKVYFIRVEAIIGGSAYSAVKKFLLYPPKALEYNISYYGICPTGSTTSTIKLDAAASSVDGVYTDLRVVKVSSTYGVESRSIVDYVGSTRVATISSPDWIQAPALNDYFLIFADVQGTAAALTDSGIANFQYFFDTGTPGLANTNTLANATDPLTNLVSSYNTAGTVGKLFRDNLNQTVSSRAATGDAMTLTSAYDAAKLAAPVGANMTLSAVERNAMADALLVRSLGTETYATVGAVPTVGQLLYMLLSKQFAVSITGTTMTAHKLDGSTTAMTFTLNSSVNPTSIVRAT